MQTTPFRRSSGPAQHRRAPVLNQALNQALSKTAAILGRLGAALALLALAGPAPAATAAAAHAQHKQMAMAKRAELGTGVALDARGQLWATGKESDASGQYVTLQKSADGGRTWSAPVRIQRSGEAVAADGESWPKLAFGPGGELYVAYTKPLAKPYTGEIRLVRSLDGGQSFAPPLTVHANRDIITHRFEAMTVTPDGRIYIAWIDKRDGVAAAARGEKYAGAAVYYAVSEDRGASFKGDYKVADHSCECCRLALTQNPAGKPVLMWRHVFEPNVRDHALAELAPGGAAPLQRATFDNWHVDACPHHGPALAYAADGTRHQVWFSVKDEEGGVFYASAAPGAAPGAPQRLGSAQAGHADVAVQGRQVVLAWKQFDGKSSAILGRLSADGGRTWREQELARTAQDSDQPRLLVTPSGIVLLWRTQAEGLRTVAIQQEK